MRIRRLMKLPAPLLNDVNKVSEILIVAYGMSKDYAFKQANDFCKINNELNDSYSSEKTKEYWDLVDRGKIDKANELFELLTFKNALNIDFDLLEYDREKPDFLIGFENKIIGVELTGLYGDNVPNNEALDTVIENVENAIREKHPAIKMLINIELYPSKIKFKNKSFDRLTKSERISFTKELTEVVEDFINNSNNFPDYIASIRSFDHNVFCISRVENYIVEEFNPELYKATVRKKEILLPSYWKNADMEECWLIITMSASERNSFHITQEHIDTLAIRQSYDYIYLLDTFSRKVIYGSNKYSYFNKQDDDTGILDYWKKHQMGFLESQQGLFHYTSIETCILILKNQTLKFSAASELADKFELSSKSIKFDFSVDKYNAVRKIVGADAGLSPEDEAVYGEILAKCDAETLKQIFEDCLSEMRNRIGIFCCARTAKNEMLWANYASKNKGVTLEFSFEDSVILPNEILADGPIIPLPVLYDDNSSPYDYFDQSTAAGNFSMVYLTCSKKKSYQYEDEIRLVSLNENGYFPFSKKILKALYFGSDCDLSSIEKIRETLKSNNFYNVKLYKMKADKELGELISMEL